MTDQARIVQHFLYKNQLHGVAWLWRHKRH